MVGCVIHVIITVKDLVLQTVSTMLTHVPIKKELSFVVSDTGFDEFPAQNEITAITNEVERSNRLMISW